MRPFPRVPLIASAAMVASAGIMSTEAAHAAEIDFLNRFQGSWSGYGTVQREGRSQPRQVTCSVTGSPEENRLSVRGNCRAAVIFSRPIGADLSYDPRSGIYRGTYTGSRIGPARLTGTRSGDAVNLRIDWPRPVNGDTQATMVIRNDGRGALRITVADNLSPGGLIQQTSEIVLQRR
jgi:hypothetical protein